MNTIKEIICLGQFFESKNDFHSFAPFLNIHENHWPFCGLSTRKSTFPQSEVSNLESCIHHTCSFDWFNFFHERLTYMFENLLQLHKTSPVLYRVLFIITVSYNSTPETSICRPSINHVNTQDASVCPNLFEPNWSNLISNAPWQWTWKKASYPPVLVKLDILEHPTS